MMNAMRGTRALGLIVGCGGNGKIHGKGMNAVRQCCEHF